MKLSYKILYLETSLDIYMYRKSYFCYYFFAIFHYFLQKFMKNTFYKNAGDKLEFAYFEPIFLQEVSEAIKVWQFLVYR